MLVLGVISVLIVLPAAADGNKKIGFDIGLSSGGIFYDGTAKDSVAAVEDSGNYHRVIIGLNGDVFYQPIPQLKIFTGADSLFDFLWNGDLYSNHIDYALLFGVKVYPNAAGFAVSAAYAFGCRNDFYNTVVDGSGKTPGSKDAESVGSSAWGNGFRIGFEYDFAHGKNIIAPAIGCYMRSMPRGSKNYDTILALYMTFGF